MPKPEFSLRDIADNLRATARLPVMSPSGRKFHESLADAIDLVKPGTPLHDLLALVLIERSIGRAGMLAGYLGPWIEANADILSRAVEMARQKAEEARKPPIQTTV